MSDACCESKAVDLEKLAARQTKVLWIVLTINIGMFFVEMIGGLIAESVALTADSLDMLGDAIAYGSSIYAVRAGEAAKLKASQLKAILMLTLGLAAFGRALYRMIYQVQPELALMTIVGLSALLANLLCLYLLSKHKDDDINFTSVWLCSRNDIIANISVLIATFLVFITQSPWPDLLIGTFIAVVFTKSAFKVFSAVNEAKREKTSKTESTCCK